MKKIFFNPDSSTSSGRRTLFLHGFPAVRSQQNRFYAELVSQRLNRETTVLLYDGLGFSDGVFSFSKTLAAVEETFLEFVKQADAAKEKIDLVGHSWGGFMSLNLASKYASSISRLVLMSPLLKFGEATRSRDAFEQTAKANPQLVLGDHATLGNDFVEVGAKIPIEKLIHSIPASLDITLLQAKDDSITPPDVVESLLSSF
ncbi:MAG: alpha/beta fold hydrolase, partial [Bdellovibrionota bacterium]